MFTALVNSLQTKDACTYHELIHCQLTKDSYMCQEYQSAFSSFFKDSSLLGMACAINHNLPEAKHAHWNCQYSAYGLEVQHCAVYNSITIHMTVFITIDLIRRASYENAVKC